MEGYDILRGDIRLNVAYLSVSKLFPLATTNTASPVVFGRVINHLKVLSFDTFTSLLTGGVHSL
jgi:hypothetical protein